MSRELAVFVVGFGVIIMALVSLAVGDKRSFSPKGSSGKQESDDKSE